ncbi:SIP domain-containing protein [Microbacteriaceae bacterium VKM Ac-2855]|nr:SIP domain-containing protein [Microbacteriaceae bacterium VKM Ac-2855]
MCMFEAAADWSPNEAKQLLIAGDETVVPTIQALLDSLPASARGQVFIEVPDAHGLPPLTAPGRFTVTWLGRATRSGAPGTGALCARGEALDRAVRAWVGEMSVIDGLAPWSDDRHDFCAWIGGAGAVVHELALDVDARLAVAAELHASR